MRWTVVSLVWQTGHRLLGDGQYCKLFEIQVFQIHTEYFVFCIWNKLQKYFVLCVFWLKSKVFERSSPVSNIIFKNILYFVFNTLRQSTFNNPGDGDRHVGIYARPDNWRTCLLVITGVLQVLNYGAILRFFASQGRYILPIIAKFGTSKETKNPLRRTKFQLDRFIYGDFWPKKLQKCRIFANLFAP